MWVMVEGVVGSLFGAPLIGFIRYLSETDQLKACLLATTCNVGRLPTALWYIASEKQA
jgi:hypothetical protein